MKIKSKSKTRQFDTYTYIRLVLLVGVVASFILMLFGVVLLSFNPNAAIEEALPLNELFSQIIPLNPMVLLNLGILVLLATPILRVIIALVSFSLERDKLYLIISATVLIILLISLIFAID